MGFWDFRGMPTSGFRDFRGPPLFLTRLTKSRSPLKDTFAPQALRRPPHVPISMAFNAKIIMGIEATILSSDLTQDHKHMDIGLIMGL